MQRIYTFKTGWSPLVQGPSSKRGLKFKGDTALNLKGGKFVNSIYWSTSINFKCSSASTFLVPVSTNLTSCQYRKIIIHENTYEGRGGKTGTIFSLNKREIYNLTTARKKMVQIYFYKDERLLTRSQKRWLQDNIRNERSYKYSGTDISRICNFNFHLLSSNSSNSLYSIVQHGCS